MAKRDTKNVRLKKNFVEEILDKIIVDETERGNKNCGYPTASGILLKRIVLAGGLKK